MLNEELSKVTPLFTFGMSIVRMFQGELTLILTKVYSLIKVK